LLIGQGLAVRGRGMQACHIGDAHANEWLQTVTGCHARGYIGSYTRWLVGG